MGKEQEKSTIKIIEEKPPLDKKMIGGIISLTLLILAIVGGMTFWINSSQKKTTEKKSLTENISIENEILSDQQVESFLSGQAEDLYNQGDLKKLSSLILEKLKINPNDENLLIALGSAYAQESVYEYNPNESAVRARVYVEKALKINPKNHWGLVVLGYTYEIENRFEEAIKKYNEALLLDSNNSDYYSRLGHVYEMKEDYKSAIENYKKALAVKENASAYSNLAKLYGKAGYADLAVENYQKALALSKNNEQKSGIYATLGSIYSSKERTEENKKKTLDYLLQAVALNDKSSLTYSNLGEEYFKRLSEDEDPEVFKNNLKKIEEYFKIAEKINPNESSIYFWYGMTALIMQKWQGAFDIFGVGLNAVDKDARLFGQEKNDQKARFYIGQSLLLANDIENENELKESLERLQLALELNKNLLKDFIDPELKKPNGGYWSGIKDDTKFKEIISIFRNK